MKIIADKDIPFIEHYFEKHGELILKPGRTISRKDLLTADVLLVRSITKVNAELLQGTSVRFVGSVTTGDDHIDTDWLDQAGIGWCTASGFNAEAVAEYVTCVIADLQKNNIVSHKPIRAGVVGVGNIGQLVADKFKALGFEVLLCDPPRGDRERDFASTSLKKFAELDLITLHTPLTKAGKYPTYRLIDKQVFRKQKPNCVLINTCRGQVIHTEDLKQHGDHLYWCFDVWDNEPEIDREILQDAFIATPHIAGYSAQSKFRGVERVYREMCVRNIITPEDVSMFPPPRRELELGHKAPTWQEIVLSVLDPRLLTQNMKTKLLKGKTTCGKFFDHMRKEYEHHHEFGYTDLSSIKIPAEDSALLGRLGFRV